MLAPSPQKVALSGVAAVLPNRETGKAGRDHRRRRPLGRLRDELRQRQCPGEQLAELPDEGGIVIEGGNSNDRDDFRRTAALRTKVSMTSTHAPAAAFRAGTGLLPDGRRRRHRGRHHRAHSHNPGTRSRRSGFTAKSAGARAGGRHRAVRRCLASGHERRPVGGPALWIRLAPGEPVRQRVRAPCGSPRPGR